MYNAICLCFISEPSLLCNLIRLRANRSQLHRLPTVLNTVLKRKHRECYSHHFIYVELVISSECVRIDTQLLTHLCPFPSDQPPEPLLVIHDKKVLPGTNASVVTEAFREGNMLSFMFLWQQRNHSFIIQLVARPSRHILADGGIWAPFVHSSCQWLPRHFRIIPKKINKLVLNIFM